MIKLYGHFVLQCLNWYKLSSLKNVRHCIDYARVMKEEFDITIWDERADGYILSGKIPAWEYLGCQVLKTSKLFVAKKLVMAFIIGDECLLELRDLYFPRANRGFEGPVVGPMRYCLNNTME